MADEKTVRLGLIGAGWWACFYTIPELLKLPGVELIAVCRPEEDELAKVKEQFKIPQAYQDYKQLLAEAEVDGVVVASPHVLHFEHASAALEAGKHVVIEKPLCTSAADARKLEQLAADRKLQIMVPCGWNFKPWTRRAKQLVADGAVGEVRHMIVQMASALDDLFAGQPMLETAEHMYRPPPSTWADPKRAGGYGWGQLSHVLALAMHITDLQPRRVRGSAVRSDAGVDYYDAAVVDFDGGATASVSGAATMPKDKGFKLELRLFGSEGVLILDIEHERLEVQRLDGEHVANQMEPGDGAYACVEPYAKLAAYCRGDSPVNDSPATANRRVVEILDAMYRSFASGTAEEV